MTPTADPSPDDLAGRAARALSRERYDEAIDLYERLLERRDARPVDRFHLALARYKTGRFDACRETLDLVLEETGELAAAWYLRGLVRAEEDAPAEAIESLERAVELDPDRARAWFHRGTLLFSSDPPVGDAERAEDDLLRATELAPSFLHAHYNLGVVAAAIGHWDVAREAFARCLELEPGNRAEYVSLVSQIGRIEALKEAHGQVHRLKNLVGILGEEFRSLEPALDDLEGEDAERADRIGRSLERLFDEMVRYLRLMDRDKLELDLLDPEALLQKVLIATRPRLDDVEIEREVADDLPDIVGDRSAIEEALVNLLLNAVDAVPPGEGTIGIRLETVPGEKVAFTVTDSGPGVAPEARDRIFRFGYTTRERGTGIGLAYARQIAEAHGGELSLVDPDDRDDGSDGASFRLVLAQSPTIERTVYALEPRTPLFEDVADLMA